MMNPVAEGRVGEPKFRMNDMKEPTVAVDGTLKVS